MEDSDCESAEVPFTFKRPHEQVSWEGGQRRCRIGYLKSLRRNLTYNFISLISCIIFLSCHVQLCLKLSCQNSSFMVHCVDGRYYTQPVARSRLLFLVSTTLMLDASGQHRNSRMNIALIMTAVKLGAIVANYYKVTALHKSPGSRLDSAHVKDTLTRHTVSSFHG